MLASLLTSSVLGDPTVVGAVVGSLIVGAFTVLAAGIQAHKTRARVAAVHDEVRTNNGKRAGEYIESMGEQMADAVGTAIGGMGQVLAEALQEHTASDAENFEELRHMLLMQDERDVERIALHRAERKADHG